MLSLLIATFFGAVQDKDPRVVSLTVNGMVGNAAYVAVQKALEQAPAVTAVRFWVENDRYSIHVFTCASLKLTSLNNALRAAERELKTTLNMDVTYEMDESHLLLTGECMLSVTGGEAILEALKLVATVLDRTPREAYLDVRLAAMNPPVTLAALRKVVEQAGERIVDLSLSGVPPRLAIYACPNGCSASPHPAICPKCMQSLTKKSSPPPINPG